MEEINNVDNDNDEVFNNLGVKLMISFSFGGVEVDSLMRLFVNPVIVDWEFEFINSTDKSMQQGNFKSCFCCSILLRCIGMLS